MEPEPELEPEPEPEPEPESESEPEPEPEPEPDRSRSGAGAGAGGRKRAEQKSLAELGQSVPAAAQTAKSGGTDTGESAPPSRPRGTLSDPRSISRPSSWG